MELATHTPPEQTKNPLLLARIPSGEQAAPTVAHSAWALDRAKPRNKAAAALIAAILALNRETMTPARLLKPRKIIPYLTTNSLWFFNIPRMASLSMKTKNLL